MEKNTNLNNRNIFTIKTDWLTPKYPIGTKLWVVDTTRLYITPLMIFGHHLIDNGGVISLASLVHEVGYTFPTLNPNVLGTFSFSSNQILTDKQIDESPEFFLNKDAALNYLTDLVNLKLNDIEINLNKTIDSTYL